MMVHSRQRPRDYSTAFLAAILAGLVLVVIGLMLAITRPDPGGPGRITASAAAAVLR